MAGKERRKAILKILKRKKRAVPGSEIAETLGVTRQVIVQDIALLRAENKNILSTNQGYLLFDPKQDEELCKRVLMVKHTTEQLLDELYIIVDHGGKMLDVSVDHEIYGQISVDLMINNRKDADAFHKKLQETKAAPLKVLTYDGHYHTIAAESEDVLDEIEAVLRKKGYMMQGK